MTSKAIQTRQFCDRVRKVAVRAAMYRLIGHIRKAQEEDHKIERFYASAKNLGLSECAIVDAEEKGRAEGRKKASKPGKCK